MNDPKIIVALDFPHAELASKLIVQLDPMLCHLKVGKELFTAAGPEFIKEIQDQGYKVFLDLKFHDIPNTVAQACKVAADLGVWMLNVHASGGRAMLKAARQAIDDSRHKPLLIGVTVLTSLETSDLKEIGIQSSSTEQVLHLAKIVAETALDGVVCSAQEATLLRAQHPKNFLLVTPGIRPDEAGQDDQRRTMTPKAALAAGSDYLVIGRPITETPDPLEALINITANL